MNRGLCVHTSIMLKKFGEKISKEKSESFSPLHKGVFPCNILPSCRLSFLRDILLAPKLALRDKVATRKSHYSSREGCFLKEARLVSTVFNIKDSKWRWRFPLRWNCFDYYVFGTSVCLLFENKEKIYMFKKLT